jgi:hypothetical protein
MLEVNHIDCFKRCTVIYGAFEDIILADSKRERSVGYEVILSQLCKFEVPSITEGWDGVNAVQVHNQNAISHSVETAIETLKNYDQGSHYHTLSLGEHLNKTKQLAAQASTGEIFKIKNARGCLVFASAIHDIGKPLVKALNKKGEYSYYNHQNVGAYLSFLYSNIFHQEEMFFIAWLVQYHMMPYFWVNQEQTQKFIDLWGVVRYNILMTLHSADKLAH